MIKSYYYAVLYDLRTEELKDLAYYIDTGIKRKRFYFKIYYMN